jgi:hypothetical protein
MTQPLMPTQVIAARTRAIRKSRGWSANRLATEMAKAGVAWDRSIQANLENDRRASVSVEEWLALAFVLDVPPIHLLVPPEEGSGHAFTVTVPPDSGWPVEVPGKDYAATPAVSHPAGRVRAWITGRHPLPGTDVAAFLREIPKNPWRPGLSEIVGVIGKLAPGLGELVSLMRPLPKDTAAAIEETEQDLAIEEE